MLQCYIFKWLLDTAILLSHRYIKLNLATKKCPSSNPNGLLPAFPSSPHASTIPASLKHVLSTPSGLQLQEKACVWSSTHWGVSFQKDKPPLLNSALIGAGSEWPKYSFPAGHAADFPPYRFAIGRSKTIPTTSHLNMIYYSNDKILP